MCDIKPVRLSYSVEPQAVLSSCLVAQVRPRLLTDIPLVMKMPLIVPEHPDLTLVDLSEGAFERVRGAMTMPERVHIPNPRWRWWAFWRPRTITIDLR